MLTKNKMCSYMPVEIIFGKNCVKENENKFNNYNNVFIVTDGVAARKSGALIDVENIMKSANKEFYIYEKVKENPLLSTCYQGGVEAQEFGADLIVGIGGGSSIDAAKAIALFAANPGMKSAEGLFSPPYENEPLPIFAIPTTAGTGSEANPYAIITLDGKGKKRTYNYIKSYSKTAFLDPGYTVTMPYLVTVSTALDAFCHCTESIFSPKSTAISMTAAFDGLESIFPHLSELADKDAVISYDTRTDLLYGSYCGGVAINTTGTGFPHPLGYNLTLNTGLAHGFACAVFIPEYIKMQREYIESEGSPEQKSILTKYLTITDGLSEHLAALAQPIPKFSQSVLETFTQTVSDAKNYQNSLNPLPLSSILPLYKKICLDSE